MQGKKLTLRRRTFLGAGLAVAAGGAAVSCGRGGASWKMLGLPFLRCAGGSVVAKEL
jgi:hypothetical protein